MKYYSNLHMLPLNITKAQARMASHQGECDDDVETLCNVPAIARQLAKLDPAKVASELREYGAWDNVELADHQQNLRRFVWLAAGDIVEGNI